MATLPDFGAAVFGDPTDIDNQYFPLPPGTINSSGASVIDPESGEEEFERDDHFVTFETRIVDGVDVIVVRHTAYANGLLVEDTLDFYAQDDAGNVWYLGESVVNYRYDDDGAFLGTDFDGAWETGVDGALPGWIMETAPATGDSYFQEFYPGVAVDEGEVIATGLDLETDFGSFSNVVKILDTSALDPGVGAFKYYAPGIGQVFEEEILLAAPDDPELVIELENIRLVDNSVPVDPSDLAFEGDGSAKTITFLGEAADANSAVGIYFFDTATGEIGEGRILFANTEDAIAGDSVSIVVPAGQSLGLFLIPNVDDLGIELEDYLAGGLHFRNFLEGDVADIYDGDPDTNFTPGTATIYDGIAPLVTDDDGNFLPILAYHSAGNRDGFNFLNPVAGENALASAAGLAVPGVELVSFEEGLASTDNFDGDFDDAFVAVSDEPLGADDLETLLDEIGISRIVGTDNNNRIKGSDDDDQIVGLDGADRLFGCEGDDEIQGGDDDDRISGGDDDDEIDGEEGNDTLYGEEGEDEIDGGEGDDRVFGGEDGDLLEGGAGNDTLNGGKDHDTILGGEGDDLLDAGDDGARMAGGAGDDTMKCGGDGPSICVFDLIDFGDDVIKGFEDGRDTIEIATYTGVSGFADITVEQQGNAALLSFADGTVLLKNVGADDIDATDFDFV